MKGIVRYAPVALTHIQLAIAFSSFDVDKLVGRGAELAGRVENYLTCRLFVFFFFSGPPTVGLWAGSRLSGIWFFPF